MHLSFFHVFKTFIFRTNSLVTREIVIVVSSLRVFIFFSYWVIYTYLDILLKLLHLVLISVLQESKKGEKREKGVASIFEWKAYILVKCKRSVNIWGSGWRIYISCQLTNFHIQRCRRQATTWHHREETGDNEIVTQLHIMNQRMDWMINEFGDRLDKQHFNDHDRVQIRP